MRWALFIVLLSTSLFADERIGPGPAHRGFQAPGVPNPYGEDQRPTKAELERERRQSTAYLGETLNSPGSYLRLIQQLNLEAELDLSESQREQLSGLGEFVEPADIYRQLLGNRFLPLPDQEFAHFIKRYRQVATEKRTQSNDRVKAILNDKQLKRLHEIGFQLYFIVEGRPAKAYRFRGETVPEEVVKPLRAEMRESIGGEFRGQRFGEELDLRLQAIYRVFGQEAKDAAGATYNFQLGKPHVSLGAKDETAQNGNIRRRESK